MGKVRQGGDAAGSLEPWIALQQELQARLDSSLRERLGPEPAVLVRYRKAYAESLPAATGRRLTSSELSRRLAAADLILVGDYHSLAQSQRGALRLLKRLVAAGRRPGLALESLREDAQEALDAYLARKLDEKKLLARFRQGWDFPWPPVRTLLRYARYHGLPVRGLNCDPPAGGDPLTFRDRRAARALSAFRKERPDQPLLALFGDYHLGGKGLPAALARAGFRGRLLRVFQNLDDLYWHCLSRGESASGAFELEGGDLALQGATPIMKLQSYHFWLTGQELGQDTVGGQLPTDPGELVTDLSEEVDGLMRQVARFLAIPLLEEDPATVIWMGAEDFARASRDLDWSPEEIRQVTTHLAWGHGTYLPRRNLALLGKLSQNRVAEMAGRVIHARTARIVQRPRSLVDDFYLRVVETALVFLASKIINPFRRYRDIQSLRLKLRRDDSGKNGWRRRARLILAYLEAEEDYLREDDVEAFPARLFRLKAHEHLDLTRAVGKHLGGRLHEALMDGALDPLWLRRLYFESFALEGSPTRVYFEILDRLWSKKGWSGAEQQAQQL